jgi:hypothetical protein
VSAGEILIHYLGLCPGVENCAHEPPDDGQICLARGWLRRHARPSTSTVSSYVAKGECERAVGTYISNGGLIAAAALEGYRITPSYGSNARIGAVLRKSPRQVNA